MDFSILTEHFNLIIVIACLIIGYCIKEIPWLERVSNAYIPTINAVCGIILNVLMQIGQEPVSVKGWIELAVFGALSGLAATGMYEAFRNFINK